ncbi:hypothetical protein BRC89_11370 [Halobacteriales archaeon QS_4_70_19]|nr:MAG: hypothetical protein BRC89_11370 [Halobacteriales archaeon QS_4_70_19]
MTRDDTDVSRRSVLRKGAVTASALAVGSTVASGSAAADSAGKRGGRAQVDGEVDRNRPFTIMPDGTDTRNASCMSAESAMQTYLTYRIQYCDSDDEEDASLYVIPDEAELAPNEVYEIRSVTPCRANDLQKVAFGPSNESCN